MPMRFHWRLLHGGETTGTTRAGQEDVSAIARPDVERQAAFAADARRAGIDSLLLDFGFAKPDTLLLAAAVGAKVPDVGLIVAYRSGLIAPTSFVQQVNTLSQLVGGPVSLNVVAGHSPAEQRAYGDFLDHDERYARTDEFLDVCHRYWRGTGPVDFDGRYYRVEAGRLCTPFRSHDGRGHPELHIAGNSDAARDLAVRRGTCWMRLAGTPEEAAAAVEAVAPFGVEVGLRVSVVAAPTRAEALRDAEALAARFAGDAREARHVRDSDSVSMGAMYRAAEAGEWITPALWTGLVRTHGSAAVALVGSADEVAAALAEYGRAGVTQVILSGWPKWDALTFFGREVLPRVRERERLFSLSPAAGERENTRPRP